MLAQAMMGLLGGSEPDRTMSQVEALASSAVRAADKLQVARSASRTLRLNRSSDGTPCVTLSPLDP